MTSTGMTRFFFPLMLLAATGCGTAAPPPAGVGQSACHASASSNWTAWIDATPGAGGRPRMIVSGTIETPTGGYRIRWADMRVLESYPVQIVADLEVIPPSRGATQAVVSHAVRGEWPVDPPVGSFTVRCGDRILASISPVAPAY